MASPQTANGFTMLANELLEAFIAGGFSRRELVVLLCIARLTYGYKKQKVAPISAKQIADLTGLHPNHVRTTLVDLIKAGVLLETEQGIGIQKDYERWAVEQPNQLQKATKSVALSNQISCKTATNLVATAPATSASDAHIQTPKEKKESKKEIYPPTPKGDVVPDEVPFSEPLLDEPEPVEVIDDTPNWKKDASFAAFWAAFPRCERKKSAAKAFKAWSRHRLGAKHLQTVLSRLEEDKASHSWLKDGGAFIPAPDAWLNKMRWQDDPANLIQFPARAAEGEPEWLPKWMRGKGTQRDVDFAARRVAEFARIYAGTSFPESEVMKMCEERGLVATFAYYRELIQAERARREAANG